MLDGLYAELEREGQLRGGDEDRYRTLAGYLELNALPNLRVDADEFIEEDRIGGMLPSLTTPTRAPV
jgi:hypothetical protein